MLLQVILEWICFLFVSISLPIYIFFVLILFIYRNTRELKGAFFKLCLSLGICDILSMFNNYIGYRFPSWGWGVNYYLNGGAFLAKFFILIAWGLRMVQGMGVTLLAVNRATAVIWPHKYIKWWSVHVVQAAIGLQILNGILFALPLSFQQFHWEIDNTSSMVIKFNDNVFKAKYFMIAFFGQTVLVIVITICYTSMYISFHRKNKQVTSQDEDAHTSKQLQERKLAVMGAIVCFFEILWFIFVLYTSVISPLSTDTFYLIYNTLTDVYSGVNPYLMFVFSSAVRDRAKTVLGFKVKSPAFALPSRALGSISPAMASRTQTPRRIVSISIESNVIVSSPT